MTPRRAVLSLAGPLTQDAYAASHPEPARNNAPNSCCSSSGRCPSSSNNSSRSMRSERPAPTTTARRPLPAPASVSYTPTTSPASMMTGGSPVGDSNEIAPGQYRQDGRRIRRREQRRALVERHFVRN